MKSRNLKGAIAGVILLCLCLSAAPVHAVEQGDTLYIGEAGLNLTHALNDAQGSPHDGVPPVTNVGWWASGSTPPDAPGYILNLGGSYQNFSVSPLTFQGYTGKYFVVNTSGQPIGSYVFSVEYPSPAADFAAGTTVGPVPLTVQFNDSSTGFPAGWAWFFGDEDYSEAWTEQSSSAGWTAGPGSDSAVLPDGSIVLIRNGVWRSVDQGISWTQVNPSPPFGDGDTVVMPDGTLLHMNYNPGPQPHYGEVWRSMDSGITWIYVNMTANWDSGSQYTNLEKCVVLPDGTILLTYYHSMAGDWTAVMRSTDQGISWTNTGMIGGFRRTGFELTAMPDGSVISSGGLNLDGDYFNDVWRSTDNGVTWMEQNASAGWTPRADHTCVAMPDGSIVLMGGYGTSIPGRDEVWRSADNGATWTMVTGNADWPARTGAASVAMPDGSIVLMGGEQTPGFGPYNDVWRLMPAGSSAQHPSHTFDMAGTYQVALQVFNDAGYNSVRKTGYITAVPPGRAEAIANGNSYLGQNPQTIGEEELLVSDQEVPPATDVKLLNGQTIQSPAGSSTWVEFIDFAKNDNWGHPARLVFYTDGQVMNEYDVDFPPSEENIVTFLHEGGNFPNYEGRTTIGIDPDPDYACGPDASHNYAVLISGGGDSSQNYARYYNDIKFLYKTLVGPNYKYSADHIKVVMSDGGDDTSADQKTSSGTTNSNPNLAGTGTVNITRATKANVTEALRHWGALTSSDTLFVFTTGHGEKVTTTTDNTNDVNLLLWGGEKITDTELVNALPANPKVLMVMEQCYGGGFKDEFIPSSGTKTRVLATAAKGNEASHSNDYSYYWITAAAGQDSAATPIPVDADKNPVNGQVSGREAHTYANNLDPSRIAGVETPQFFEWTTNPAAGSITYAGSCAVQPSITVTVPAGTWAARSAKTITWTYTGFSTTPTVKIELWNSTNWQADIKTSIAANIKTFTWTLPATLPGGSQGSYYVKISTIGTSQLISGQSAAFSVSGVSTQWPGALYVTSSPTGATINLRDPSYNPVKIGGVEQIGQTTNKNWSSISPGRYWVKVAKSCYQDVSFAQKQVNPNATTSAPFTLVAIPAASCINGMNTGPTGSIAIYSLPQEGYRVYLKGGPAGGTLDSPEYIDMGYETPVIQDLGAGDYMVKLAADGFVSQEQQVTVKGGEQESVYFELSQDPEWYSFTGFDAPIEMSTSTQSVFNTAKAGNNIPVKWHLSDGSGYIDDAATFILKFDKISCPGKKIVTHEIEVLDPAAPNSGLIYLGNGSWHYNWKTTKGDTKCYTLYLEFNNGLISPVAKFQLK